MSGHQFLNPAGLGPARGFSHGAVPSEGKTLYIAGQIGHHEDMTLDDGLVEQFAHACRSVAAVIAEAGGDPTDLVSMTIYTTDVPGTGTIWARSGRNIARCSASISLRWP